VVQRQQSKDFGVGESGAPPVGGEDGFVEFAMSVGEPLRAAL
jgi:hypothetical protein